MTLPRFTLDNLIQQAEDIKVFMCRQCRLPLGDSSNCNFGLQSEDNILLDAVSEYVCVHSEKILSNYQDEDGSLYQALTCKGCSSPIGKFFFSTSKECDHHLERFLLNEAAITVYSFGSVSKQVVKPSDTPITLQNCHHFENEIKKCKTLLGALQRKVEKIESFLYS